MFRRLTAAVFPIIVVGCALVSTLGLMAIFKVPIKIPTAVLPSLIMAVGVADSIHILTLFYRQPARTGKKIESIAHAMGHSALAIVLTTLTTAAVCAILMTLSLIGAFQLTFTHHVLKWLPATADVRIATEKIDSTLKGSVVMEVIVDSGQVNGLFDIDILNNLEGLAREVEKIKQEDLFVGKATSAADILKEIHRALNENRPEYYAIAQDPALIPQEFLLFENSGSDDLEDVVDSQFQTARFTIKVPWLDAVKYVTLLENLVARFDRSLGDKARISMTGMMTILFSTMVSAIYSAAESYIIAGVVITVMVILLIGSFRIGLPAMLPNLFAILFVMGLMGIFNFPFDLFTMLLGSIAIGLAEWITPFILCTTSDVTTQRRLTSLVPCARLYSQQDGLYLSRPWSCPSVFFIYMFATMNNLFYFGLLTGITIVLALVANFFLAPAPRP